MNISAITVCRLHTSVDNYERHIRTRR